ncbi:Predicted Co/Zn/Cd cation transporters [Legionella londiniensis]|uniref:Cation efflux family protein n=2 Tax=Legionella londiniensis TaxID=45068 RepID=A0A0W0VSQ8_9GAMM|nr:Cation efflux family protein [Legionella londiniensis]STX94088.1 Predicted Co/Zn/Cd cation transporters [Legionella londiniensis]
MKLAPQYEFTDKQTHHLHKARKLAYMTIAYLASVALLTYLVMGSSQTMKTVWIDDVLSMIPSLSFLISSYICWKKPNHTFPYGYHRAISISFLCASLALLVMGIYLLIDAFWVLINKDYPTIGLFNAWGYDIWLGWIMILVLLYGVFPPIFLGKAKLKIAPLLYDKVLYTDAKMNRADWLIAFVAIIGVAGIAYGFWWSDAVAASFVSLSILHDGIKQTSEAVTLLMDKAPCDLEGKELNLPHKVIKLLENFSWVKKAEVRLREQGHLIFGEGFLYTTNHSISHKQIKKAAEAVMGLDWRLKNFVLTIIED